jgi:hypothetical protein
MSPRGVRPVTAIPAIFAAAGVETAGVETACVETAGVETACVETAGVETAGVETAGVETAGVETLPGLAGGAVAATWGEASDRIFKNSLATVRRVRVAVGAAGGVVDGKAGDTECGVRERARGSR